MPDFNVCRQRPFLLGIDRDTFKKLTAIARYRKYQPGDVIIREGEQKDEILLIEEGQVEVYKSGASRGGAKHKITTLAGSNKLYELSCRHICLKFSCYSVSTKLSRKR